ncbi:AAA family ATPase [Candidatus Poribacteria bacterium]|nr:AAA family ATPase [Candidatus Poribacteria bacterium]
MEQMTMSLPGIGTKSPPLTEIAITGFKSIATRQSIQVGNLTLLAGANSSGKSSIMQPILLMKQTLEAPADPGALLLRGPNAKFTHAAQLFWHSMPKRDARSFLVEFRVSPRDLEQFTFAESRESGINIERLFTINRGTPVDLRARGQSSEDLARIAEAQFGGMSFLPNYQEKWDVRRHRCFLELVGAAKDGSGLPMTTVTFHGVAREFIQAAIHLPGLRGNPERTYQKSAVSTGFPGTFENYTASLLSEWGNLPEGGRLAEVSSDLRALGLTWMVEARRVNDVDLEIRVGRLPETPRRGSGDLVNIADVGFGVSQTMPVVVALHAAQAGQTVYIEQPELHLHPRAQIAMAGVLARAAQRGVRVIAETHSRLILLGLQSMTARGELEPDFVKLNWFQRDKKGCTKITSGSLDEMGRYGEWPEDFDDVSLDAESEYLDAVGLHFKGGKNG